MRAATVVQVLQDLFTFYCIKILLVIAPLPLIRGVRFRSSQSEIWQTVRVVPRDSYSLTVYGLRPRTRYQFMVLARDQYGVAHFSRIVNAMTARLANDRTKNSDSRTQLTFLGNSLAYLSVLHENVTV